MDTERSNARRRVASLKSLPVGWAALANLALGATAAVMLTLSHTLRYDAAAFLVAMWLAGLLLGLATWDLFVALLAKRFAPPLALPDSITLEIPRRLVPALSPCAFVAGLLIGHQLWH